MEDADGDIVPGMFSRPESGLSGVLLMTAPGQHFRQRCLILVLELNDLMPRLQGSG